MIREKVARALTAHSLQSSPDSERPVDVVGAMGAISQFSSLLYRLKYAGELSRHNADRAVLLLARKLRTPVSDSTTRIARLALGEWLFDRCLNCRGRCAVGGRREMIITRRRSCKLCHATGMVERTTPKGIKLIIPCTQCRGRMYIETSRVVLDDAPRVCNACGGTGRLVMTDTEHARILGITTDQAKAWRKHIDRALDILRHVDAIAASVLRQQLI
jgi:hypothetical protein